MKQSVNLYAFREAFKNCNRSDNFSYEGLEALFEYLEELEQDLDEEFELDVISLCCAYSEWSTSELLLEYFEELHTPLTREAVEAFIKNEESPEPLTEAEEQLIEDSDIDWEELIEEFEEYISQHLDCVARFACGYILRDN